ncbi:oligosaccharide flippase family protein [Streptomyces sp. MAR4 CNX-425]|uniref:lipopolysaccharide biosynthesis protein n=1 Tax=Streptomyces sp. MAR4 CNX-425 TaxID=3406343 RepID=UPI003B504320
MSVGDGGGAAGPGRGGVGRLLRGVRAGRVSPGRGWGARLRRPWASAGTESVASAGTESGAGAGTESGAGDGTESRGTGSRRGTAGATPPGDAGPGADAWRYGSAACGVLLHLGFVAYAARHVSPAALGAYAVALTAVHLLVHVAGTGIAASLHRAATLDRPTAHAALRLAGVTGFAGFAVAQAAAPLPAVLLHTPDTTPLLRLLACSFLCHPAAEAALAALHRAGRARAAVLTDAGGQAGGVATGVLLLAAGVNPLGLAAVLPAAAALTLGAAGLLLFRTPLPDGAGAAAVRAASLVRVSRFAAGFGLLRLVAAGAPLWAVCRLLGAGPAGVYSRAAALCELPVAMALGGGRVPYRGQGREVRSLLGPGGVRGRDRGRGRGGGRGDEPDGRGPETGHHPRPDGRPAPVRAPRRARRVDVPAARLAVTGASAAAFAGFGAAAGVGPAALAVLLGPGWGSATALVPWLCAAAAAQLLYSAGCSLDLARGRRRALLGTQLVVLLTTAAAFALVLPWRGSGHALPLFACAAAAGPAAGHALQLVRWGRCGLVRVREVLRAHAVHAGIGAAAGALATVAGSTAAEPGPALLYGLLALAPVAVLCAALHERLPLSAALTGRRAPAAPAPAPRPRTPDRAPAHRRAPGAPVP